MNSLDKMRRAGLVNRVRRDLANWEFHLAGMHDQKSHGNWATGLGDETGVNDSSDKFGGFFDPHNLASDVVRAGGSRALAAIDKVHGLENGFPETIVMIDNGEWLGEEGTLGAYMAPEPDNKEGPIDRGRMVIRATDDEGQIASTMAHEFGHHVSLGMGIDKFHEEMAREGSALSDWLDVVSQSAPIKDLVKINKQAKTAFDSAASRGDKEAGMKAMDAAGFTDYLLMPEEVFARSYAQWVAVKTGDPVMLADFNKVLRDENMSLSQWTPEEFIPISDALDKYFKERGLLR